MTPTCPFCGATPRAIRGQFVRTRPPPHAWCESCGATGPRRDTEAEALDAFTLVARARRIGDATLASGVTAEWCEKHARDLRNARGSMELSSPAYGRAFAMEIALFESLAKGLRGAP